MLCATQCPPPPCIPPDALVFDYENMLEPGFCVSSQQKNVREVQMQNYAIQHAYRCTFINKVDNKNTSDYEETKITTFVIHLKRFSLMIAQLHKWTIGQFDPFR